MTRDNAMFELMELAQSVIHASHRQGESTPELFAIAEQVKDEILARHQASEKCLFSDEYVKANEWLLVKIRQDISSEE